MKRRFSILIGLLGVALGSASAARGQLAQALPCPGGVCPQPQAGAPAFDPRLTQAIVRVRNRTERGSALGSGTLVEKTGDFGVVLSCAHLFREGTGRLEVTFPDGRASAANLVALDAARDLSALVIRAPSANPVAVARRAPAVGDPLWSSGYGGQGVLATNYGRAVAFISVQGSPANSAIELTGTARSGDSGGPIFNARGELAGVIFGTNGRVVDGTHSVEVCKFLDGVFARLQQPLAGNRRLAPVPERPSNAAPQIDLGDAAETTRLREQLEAARAEQKSLRATIGGLQMRVDDLLAKAAEAARGAAAEGGGVVDRAATTAGTAWLTKALVAFGLPGGIAGVAAGGAVWLVMRRARRRFAMRTSASPSSIDNIEVPPLERHHNQYVAYEISSRDKAWASAHAQIGQKYPGAVPYLKLAEGVKDQLLSGQSTPSA